MDSSVVSNDSLCRFKFKSQTPRLPSCQARYRVYDAGFFSTSDWNVEVAMQASYFGQRTIFGVISHLFPTITFFHFFRITVQAGIPTPSFSSVLLLGD